MEEIVDYVSQALVAGAIMAWIAWVICERKKVERRQAKRITVGVFLVGLLPAIQSWLQNH